MTAKNSRGNAFPGMTGALRRSVALLAAAAALVVSGPLSAQWTDGEGRRLPDSERMKSLADFSVQIVLTADEGKFRDTWNRSTTPPRLETTDRVRPGGQVAAMLLFHGCFADTSGGCNAMVRFALVSPDGTLTPAGEWPLWAGPLVKNRVLLSDASMAVGFDKNDKAGTYVALAIIVDKRTGRQVQVHAPITLQ